MAKKKLTKEHLAALKAGRERKRKEDGEPTQLLFKCKNYKIEKIPYNYKITIKCARKGPQGVERDWYSLPEHGIEEAHIMAEFAMEESFVKDKKPKIPKKEFWKHKNIR